jgi:hypothetical protein
LYTVKLVHHVMFLIVDVAEVFVQEHELLRLKTHRQPLTDARSDLSVDYEQITDKTFTAHHFTR